MNIEVYLHGVIRGQDFSTQNEDKEYLRQFYNIAQNSKASTQFIVEVVRDNIYYTLLKSNLLNIDGRSGSYFGLTLRLDKYYSENTENIYILLDNIYSNKVLNNIIKDSKYIVSEFSDNRTKEIEKIIIEYIEKKLGYYLKQIDNTFSNRKGNIVKLNINEVSNQHIISILKKNSIICLSPEYPTYNEQVKKLSKRLENKISEYSSLENTIRNLTGEKNNLEMQNRELRESNRKLQNQKSFMENIDKIETPIEEIAEYLRERKSVANKGFFIFTKKILLIIIAILLVINIVFFNKFSNTLKEIKRNTTPQTEESPIENNTEDSYDKPIDSIKYDTTKFNNNNNNDTSKTNGNKKV